MLMQLLYPLPCFIPLLQLAGKEVEHFFLRGGVVPTGIHLATCLDFKGAQTVFVGIIAVDLFRRKSRVGVTLPTTTQIEFVINATDTEMTRECQSKSIVFSITGIGETNGAKQ